MTEYYLKFCTDENTGLSEGKQYFYYRGVLPSVKILVGVISENFEKSSDLEIELKYRLEKNGPFKINLCGEDKLSSNSREPTQKEFEIIKEKLSKKFKNIEFNLS
jgi:hypothetical protein